MKGIIAKSITAAALASVAASSGCSETCGTGKCYDLCYPERYYHHARTEVIAAFAPQVQNGHILDQTVWNYHFEPGKEDLNAGGRDHLDGLVRRRPHPDARVFLATARDLAYDPLNPNKLVDARRELDEKRAVAIQNYLQAQTAGRPQQFEVVVHDPAEVGQHAYPANRSVLLYHNTTSGSALVSSSASTAGQGQNNSNQGTPGAQSGSR